MRQRLLCAAVVWLVTATAAFSQSSTWFLAEGASNAFFDEDILVVNPNTSTIAVTIRLLPDPFAVANAIERTWLLGPLTRATYNLKTEFNLNGASSAQVSAVIQGSSTPADIIVERSMYFPDANRAGGHNASGVTAAAERWILAEGASTIFNTFVLVTNPNGSAVPIRVTYLRGNAPPVTFTETLAAHSRRTFWPQVEQPVELGNAEFSTIVESLTGGLPIVAERAMYFDYPNASSFARSGHDALGVPGPSTTWYFAEGNTGGNPAIAFETFLLLANQNATPTNVTVTYQLDSGAAISKVYTVPARARYNVWVDDEGLTFDSRLRSSAFGISVEATQPIVAERAMYWGTPSAADPTTPSQPWAEGHATAGAPQRASKWGFAEGAQDFIDATGIRYQTFVLLSNPNPTPIAVRATFLRSDGTGMQRDTCVPGNGRANVWAAVYPELSNQRFATFVETATTNAQGICGVATAGGEQFVAERAMYWRDGFTGGHANVGTPWTKLIATPPAPNVTLTASLAAPTSGRLSGGQWVDINVQNVAADAEVWFGSRKASAVQFQTVNGNGILRAQTPLRTPATGYGSAGPVNVEVRSAGRSAQAGQFTFLFSVLVFGDSITWGTFNIRMTDGTKIAVQVSDPYPLSLKNGLASVPQFGAYTRVMNAGYPGEQATGEGESRMPRCLAAGAFPTCAYPNGGIVPGDFVRPFDVVVLFEGVNDLINQRPPERARDALRTMIVTAKSNGVPVILGRFDSFTVNEDTGAWTGLDQTGTLASLTEALAVEQGLTRIAFTDIAMTWDGVHPNQLGYNRMAALALEKVLGRFPSAPQP